MIISFKDLSKLRQKHKDKKIVLGSGVFDLIHSGHVEYLQQLKQHGEVIVVMVKSDARVSAGKGPTRPMLPEKDRLIMVDSIKGVDYVFVSPPLPFIKGPKDPLYKIVFAALKPDVFYTTNSFWSFLEELNQTKVIIAKRPIKKPLRSTTSIIEHIQRKTKID